MLRSAIFYLLISELQKYRQVINTLRDCFIIMHLKYKLTGVTFGFIISSYCNILLLNYINNSYFERPANVFTLIQRQERSSVNDLNSYYFVVLITEVHDVT